MRAVSLATLSTRVRQRTDTEAETARFPAALVTDAINEGIAKLHSMLVRSYGSDYFESEYTFPTSAGIESYALPATFLGLKKVFTYIQGVETAFRRYETLDTDGFIDTDSWQIIQRPMYRLKGSNISFRPFPDAVYNITLLFTPCSVILGNPTEAVDGINGLEEYIVAWAGKRVAMMQRDWALCDRFDSEMANAEREIQAVAVSRDGYMQPQMRDVRTMERNIRRWRWRA